MLGTLYALLLLRVCKLCRLRRPKTIRTTVSVILRVASMKLDTFVGSTNRLWVSARFDLCSLAGNTCVSVQ